MPKVPSKQDLAINGGRPLHDKPWRDGPYHYRAELKAMEKVLSGPRLPLARGRWLIASS